MESTLQMIYYDPFDEQPEKDRKGYRFLTNMSKDGYYVTVKAIKESGQDIIIKGPWCVPKGLLKRMWKVGDFSLWTREVDCSKFWKTYDRYRSPIGKFSLGYYKRRNQCFGKLWSLLKRSMEIR